MGVLAKSPARYCDTVLKAACPRMAGTTAYRARLVLKFRMAHKDIISGR
jgi:hypothetical protein